MNNKTSIGLLCIFLFFVWLMISISASSIKMREGNCWKELQLDYFVATNLLCEVKGSD